MILLLSCLPSLVQISEPVPQLWKYLAVSPNLVSLTPAAAPRLWDAFPASMSEVCCACCPTTVVTPINMKLLRSTRWSRMVPHTCVWASSFLTNLWTPFVDNPCAKQCPQLWTLMVCAFCPQNSSLSALRRENTVSDDDNFLCCLPGQIGPNSMQSSGSAQHIDLLQDLPYNTSYGVIPFVSDVGFFS